MKMPFTYYEWTTIAQFFLSMSIVFFGVLKGTKETTSKTKIAVGGFIGFIPFGFGNDKNLVWFVAILSLVLFAVWIFFSLRFFN